MLSLSPECRYFLYNGTADMRKGVFGLAALVREDIGEDPLNPDNVYIFMGRSLKTVKILRYERGFFVLYEKRPLRGRFKRPIYDDDSRRYQISWSDLLCLTEGVVVASISVGNKGAQGV